MRTKRQVCEVAQDEANPNLNGSKLRSAILSDCFGFVVKRADEFSVQAKYWFESGEERGVGSVRMECCSRTSFHKFFCTYPIVSIRRMAIIVSTQGKRQYRSKLEITANILEIAKEGSRKTRIMYLGNLSFDLLQKYLKQLEQLGLVIVKNTADGERVYNVTEKGREFLTDFYELQKHAEIANTKKSVLESTLAQK